MPDALLRAEVGFELPPVGEYAVGIAFLPGRRRRARRPAWPTSSGSPPRRGWPCSAGASFPVDPDGADLGPTARAVMPHFTQLFVAETMGARADEKAFGGNVTCNGVTRLERRAFVLRKRAERAAAEAGSSCYFPSLSSRTITYKGMLTTDQLPAFFPDLRDERYESAIALVHSRFSTNTFPSWPLAHPFRLIAHNGEINTIKGNRNRMRAREAMLETQLFDAPEGSPAAELGLEPDLPGHRQRLQRLGHLRRGARAAAPVGPVAAARGADDDPGGVGEPRRDGPGPPGLLPVPLLDHGALGRPGRGRVHRRHADRRGARPQRAAPGPLVAHQGRPGRPRQRGRRARHPGRPTWSPRAGCSRAGCSSSTPPPGRIVARRRGQGRAGRASTPTTTGCTPAWCTCPRCPSARRARPSHESVVRRQLVFGYTEEELRVLLTPMASTGAEPIGSMGTDTPVAALSDRSRLLYDYFSQLFAQVTNPPLDAIREELVTSLGRTFGPEQNLLEALPASCRQVFLPFPVIDNDELAKILHIDDDGDLPGFAAVRITGHFDVTGGGAGAGRRRSSELRTKVVQGDRGRRAGHRALRPRRRRAARADPVAADDRRRAPPPDPGEDPDEGRPGRGVRRLPRGAPRRAAARLRRRRGQPVPGVRVGRGPDPRRRRSPGSSPPRPCATWSRRWARACSR